MIEAKNVGTNTIVFMLEDGTKVLVKVEVGRCGKRLNEKGEAQYHLDFHNNVRFIPKNKKFKVQLPALNQKPKENYIT